MVVIIGLDSSWRMTFCSDAEDFRDRSLSLGSFHFLKTVVNPLYGGAVIAHVVEAATLVAGDGAGVPWSWVIACYM